MAILLVKVSDANVPESPAKWRAGEIVSVGEDGHDFGKKASVEAGNLYRINITDRTKDQVIAFMQTWHHDPSLSVVASNPPDYRIRLETSTCSLSGRGAFVREQIETMLDDLGQMIGGSATYHDHGRSGNTAFFVFNVLGVDADEGEKARNFVKSTVRDILVRRRRWYVNAAGMELLANNGGSISGTAQQAASYISDGYQD